MNTYIPEWVTVIIIMIIGFLIINAIIGAIMALMILNSRASVQPRKVIESRLKLHVKHYSTHIGWCFGVRFESEDFSVYSSLYGWPQKTWYIIISVGHQSYCVGFYKPSKARAEVKS